MNPEVFREYDVRGVVDKDLTPDFAYLLGRAIGTYAFRHGGRKLALGRDCRLSSKNYQDAVCRGMLSSGIDAVDIGLAATPMLYFAIRHFGMDGGVMVTGSHNPSNFNGFKICMGPETIYGQEIQSLRKMMEEGDFVDGKGSRSCREIEEAYRDHLYANVKVKPGKRIVVDGGNGVGCFFALPLLQRYGCRVTPIYCEPDGRFPHHHPDPTIPDNLRELTRLVLEQQADVGIAYDGDADRIGVVTDRGELLWGDELLLLFSRHVLKSNPGATIIGDVKCSRRLFDDITVNGGRAIMWKAGHSPIKGKLKEEKALLAGEMSGHIFFADRYFGYDDAIYASIRLLEILSESGNKLSSLLADIPRTFNTPEIRIDCPDRIKVGVVSAVREHYRKTHKMIDIDGVRVTFDDGWGLLRASNTQPVLVLRFEASTPDRLAQIRMEMESVLDGILRSMS